MKVSLQWIKTYIELDLSNQEISDKLTQLGLEATYTDNTKSFTDVLLGKVLECKSHPNADKLSICTVDVGHDSTYEIVCGAPNITSNIHVAVAMIGAELNNGEFKIKKSKIRGILSNGMICSGSELAYNNDHDGILIINSKEKLGTPIENILSFNEDVIFDLDLTPNRGDCLSHIGVARELGIATKQNVSRKKIEIRESEDNVNNLISIKIDNSDACPRYVARIVKDIQVGPSPKWMSDRLESIGLKSINNVVDAANYVLMNTGQPMHTFDLDSIIGNTINVRYAEKGEKFTTLDNNKRELDEFHLLICDQEKPIALAGIIGGLNSEITKSTTNVLIESAYFNPTVIRKGAKKIDLSTEASRRFERDVDIDSIVDSANELAYLLQEIAGGQIVKGVIDEYPKKLKKSPIAFSIEKCNSLIGIDLNEKEIIEIFSLLQIQVKKDKDNLLCYVPSFRNDLEREVDLFEEVARVFGYDNIPSSNHFFGSYDSFVKDEQHLDFTISNHLKAIGFYEHYSNSLISQEHSMHFIGGEAIKIKNPLSREMEFIRNSILPGLLMACSYNEKRQQKNFKLFEIGAVHNFSNKSYTNTKEKHHLGLLWYGESNLHWRHFEDRDIFYCKGEVAQFLNSIGFNNIHFKIAPFQGFNTALKIYYNKIQIGFLGIPDKKLLKFYDFKETPIICDISIMELREIKKLYKFNYKSPSQYPSIMRDIALQVKQNIKSEDLFKTIKEEGGLLLTDISLFDIYESEDVGNTNRSLAFSLKFQSMDSTLTDEEVDPLIQKILLSLNKSHGAIQR